jgi:hypothetical protein
VTKRSAPSFVAFTTQFFQMYGTDEEETENSNTALVRRGCLHLVWCVDTEQREAEVECPRTEFT